VPRNSRDCASAWDAAAERDASRRFVGGPRTAEVIAENGEGTTEPMQALKPRLITDHARGRDERSCRPYSFRAPGRTTARQIRSGGVEAEGQRRSIWLGVH